MHYCKFCGSTLPDNANFCGYCGNNVHSSIQEALEATRPTSIETSLTLDASPLSSDSGHIDAVNATTRLPDTGATIKSTWPGGQPVQNIQWTRKRPDDLKDTPLPDVMWPGMPVGGQIPPTGNVPLVHGTPQIGSVPVVQNTPVPYAHPSGPVIARGARSSLLHGAGSKIVVGTTMKWIILLVTAIVVVGTGGFIVVLAIPPAITLSGSSTVTAGGMLHLHGKGFLPGGSVTFTLDHGLPVSLMNYRPDQSTTHSLNRDTDSASVFQVLLAGQSELRAASNATVSVSTVGTFDTTIDVSANWSLGPHTIHATESFGSRTASLSFVIIGLAKPLVQQKLLVQQKNLTASSSNCLTVRGSGNLIVGWLCVVTLETNSGDLNWVAGSTDPSVQFTPSKGVAHPNHPESVNIFISNVPRCSNATFVFAGPTNTVSTSWRCPAH